MSPYSVAAGDFEGSKPFVCVAIETAEGAAGEERQRGNPQCINLPQIINFNFKKKIIRGVLNSGEMVSTRIEKMTRDKGKLYLHRVDDNEETGNITKSASGDQEGFIAFGVCLPVQVNK